MNLLNEHLQKNEIKNDINESCSPKLIILRENHFHKHKIGISPSKLTLNFKNAQYLSTYFYSMMSVRQEITVGLISVQNCT